MLKIEVNDTKNKNKNTGGRPRAEIDKKTFEGLCYIQATKEEICSVLDISEKTLTRWCKDIYNKGFSETYKKKSAGGKSSLRRLQFESAKKGNVSMLIWLGKQYLGQAEKSENKNIDEVEVHNINVTF